jgi:hypothetical protein
MNVEKSSFFLYNLSLKEYNKHYHHLMMYLNLCLCKVVHFFPIFQLSLYSGIRPLL